MVVDAAGANEQRQFESSYARRGAGDEEERESRTTHSNGALTPGPGLPTDTTCPKLHTASHALLRTRSTPVASMAHHAPMPPVAARMSARSVGEAPEKACVAPWVRARSSRVETRSTTMMVRSWRCAAAHSLRGEGAKASGRVCPTPRGARGRRDRTHAPNPTAPKPKMTTESSCDGLSWLRRTPALQGKSERVSPCLLEGRTDASHDEEGRSSKTHPLWRPQPSGASCTRSVPGGTLTTLDSLTTACRAKAD